MEHSEDRRLLSLLANAYDLDVGIDAYDLRFTMSCASGRAGEEEPAVEAMNLNLVHVRYCNNQATVVGAVETEDGRRDRL